MRALQEDVHVIGLSILSGAHNAIMPRVMELLRQNKMDDVLVVIGGIIPDQDIPGSQTGRCGCHLPSGHADGPDRGFHPQEREAARRGRPLKSH